MVQKTVPYWPCYSVVLWYRRRYHIGHVIQWYCGTEDGTILAMLFSGTVVQKTVPYWPYYSTVLWCRRQYYIGYIIQRLLYRRRIAVRHQTSPDPPRAVLGPFQPWSLSARPIPALVIVCTAHSSPVIVTAHSSPGHCLRGPFQPWSLSRPIPALVIVCTAHSSPGHCHGPFQPWSLSARPIPALVIICLHGLDTEVCQARHHSRRAATEGDGHR